jgi:hypothetical protein
MKYLLLIIVIISSILAIDAFGKNVSFDTAERKVSFACLETSFTDILESLIKDTDYSFKFEEDIPLVIGFVGIIAPFFGVAEASLFASLFAFAILHITQTVENCIESKFTGKK